MDGRLKRLKGLKKDLRLEMLNERFIDEICREYLIRRRKLGVKMLFVKNRKTKEMRMVDAFNAHRACKDVGEEIENCDVKMIEI